MSLNLKRRLEYANDKRNKSLVRRTKRVLWKSRSRYIA